MLAAAQPCRCKGWAQGADQLLDAGYCSLHIETLSWLEGNCWIYEGVLCLCLYLLSMRCDGVQVVHRLVALGWLEDAVGLLGLQPVWWHASAADRNENMRALVSGPASSS